MKEIKGIRVVPDPTAELLNPRQYVDYEAHREEFLHDWNDSECVEILSTIREAAPDDACLFNCEFVVPDPDQSHLAKLMDVHMMVAVGGRERTEAEYAELFEEAGFKLAETHKTEELPMSVVEARAV